MYFLPSLCSSVTLVALSLLLLTKEDASSFSVYAFTTPLASVVQLVPASTLSFAHSSTSLASSMARDLLYQDQQSAMDNRALFEQTLLNNNIKKKKIELKAPKLRAKQAKSGTGFGAGASKVDPNVQLAMEQAKVVHRDGVLRIDGALSPQLADELREYVLQQQVLAAVRTEESLASSHSFYGVENQRKSRCDLQLSLLRGGYAADGNAIGNGNVGDDDGSQKHVLADSLQHLLGEDGTLRFLYENLVTLKGEFYELAAVITDPGSTRQKVHPDLPFQDTAPLYVIFLALQDVDELMGPTSFLLRTHTAKENAIFKDPSQEVRDAQLSSAECRLSTLKKGDAILFDARILHCGNANDLENGSTRALFNFSFRNPKITADLGYKGSIRPGYTQAMNLGDIGDALIAYGKDVDGGDRDPFAKYGDGLRYV